MGSEALLRSNQGIQLGVQAQTYPHLQQHPLPCSWSQKMCHTEMGFAYVRPLISGVILGEVHLLKAIAGMAAMYNSWSTEGRKVSSHVTRNFWGRVRHMGGAL